MLVGGDGRLGPEARREIDMQRHSGRVAEYEARK